MIGVRDPQTGLVYVFESGAEAKHASNGVVVVEPEKVHALPATTAVPHILTHREVAEAAIGMLRDGLEWPGIVTNPASV